MTLALKRYSIFLASLVFLLSFSVLSIHAQSDSPDYGLTLLSDPSIPMTKSKLLEAGRLSLLYPKNEMIDTTTLKITKYTVTFFTNGQSFAPVILSAQDEFPKKVIELIHSFRAGSSILFQEVKAIKKDSSDKMVRSIPPLSIQLLDN